MLRLFSRLYFFIILSLLLITYVLDRAMLPAQDQPDPSTQILIEILHRQFEQAPTQVDSLLVTQNIPYQWLQRDQLQWPKQQQEILQEKGYILTYSQQQQHIYLLLNEQYLKLDLPLTSGNKSLLGYLITLFILFAISLGIWLLPLWRELLQINRASEHFKQTGYFPNIKVSRFTTLISVLRSINRLGTRVQELIVTQQALSATLAHEIRTPLARLKFRLEQLPEPQKTIKSAIESDIEGMETLLQTMLDYTRMQALKPELNRDEVPLHHLMTDIVEQWPLPVNSRISFNSELSEQVIIADGALVERAVSNLISNAVKYANSKVNIKLFNENHNVCIAIADDGPGIALDQQQKIFQAFVQGPKHSKNTKGAGVGLALVNLIQQWHSGSVSVESTPEQGSQFTLCYPSTVSK